MTIYSKKIILLIIFISALSSSFLLSDRIYITDNSTKKSQIYQNIDKSNENDSKILNITEYLMDSNSNGLYEVYVFLIKVYSNSTNNLTIWYKFFGYKVSNANQPVIVDSGACYYYFNTDLHIGDNILYLGITSEEILYNINESSPFGLEIKLYSGVEENFNEINPLDSYDYTTTTRDINLWDPDSNTNSNTKDYQFLTKIPSLSISDLSNVFASNTQTSSSMGTSNTIIFSVIGLSLIGSLIAIFLIQQKKPQLPKKYFQLKLLEHKKQLGKNNWNKPVCPTCNNSGEEKDVYCFDCGSKLYT